MDRTQAYETLQQVQHRLVRTVAAEGGLGKDPRRSTAEADALFEIAKGDQVDWSAIEWQTVLDELDSSELTVGEYLAGVTPPTQEGFDL